MSGVDVASHILILGGTADARSLAMLLYERLGQSIRLTTSLAGRTKNPSALSGATRVGGFGGAGGLSEYLETEDVSILVDATHPFASTISAHAADAAEQTGTPRLSIVRPPWTLPDTLDVKRVATMENAMDAIRSIKAKRVLVTTGVKDLEALISASDVTLNDTFFLIRLIEPLAAPIPLQNSQIIIQKPPFKRANERTLMSENQIDVLVSKESGGPATEAKIQAANDLGIKTILIERPAPPTGDIVSSPSEALAWVLNRLRESS